VPGAGNPQSLNRFSYVGNSPLNLIDPTGNIPLHGAYIEEEGFVYVPKNAPYQPYKSTFNPSTPASSTQTVDQGLREQLNGTTGSGDAGSSGEDSGGENGGGGNRDNKPLGPSLINVANSVWNQIKSEFDTPQYWDDPKYKPSAEDIMICEMSPFLCPIPPLPRSDSDIMLGIIFPPLPGPVPTIGGGPSGVISITDYQFPDYYVKPDGTVMPAPPVPEFADSSYEWRGDPAYVGSSRGNWVNPEVGDWLHLDLKFHGQAHWDWGILGLKFRGFPDGAGGITWTQS